MTDQQTQRYRPLAVGEVIEAGDDCKSTENLPSVIYKWGMACGHEGQRVGDVDDYIYRRPIPETRWRDPVGDAGYPYPPGTVVEEEAYPLWLFSAAHKDSIAVRVYRYKDGSYQVNNSIWLEKDCNRTIRHRVIDYRPDLLDRQPKPKKLESCTCYINVGRCPQHGGAKQPEPAPAESAELTRLRAEVERLTAEHAEAMCLITQTTRERDGWKDEAERQEKYHGEAMAELSALHAKLNGDVWYHQGDGHDEPESLTCRVVMDANSYRKFMGQQSDLRRLRANVERLRQSNLNWERLSFASAHTADATRDEIEKLRAEVKEYKTSAEIIRDFADLYKQERDEARAEVDRLTAKLAKYQPSEYQSIDLTESTVFVGAAWSEGKGEIQ